MPEFEAFRVDFAKYTRLRHAHGTTPDELLKPVRATLRFDISRWIAAGLPRDFTAYAADPGGRPVVFRLTANGEQALRAALPVWTTSLKGLTKGITRIRNSAQVRVPEVEDSTA